MKDMEIRTFNAEVRSNDKKEARVIEGIASVFDKISDNLGGFREIIHYPAFGNLITSNDVKALINHDPNLILGRNQKSKTLRLFENREGLNFEVDPPDTSYANDLLVSMERGDIDQCSFAFKVADGGDWWEERDDFLLRHVTQYEEIYDISIVVYPGFPQTTAELNGRKIITPEQVYREYRDKSTQQSQEAQKLAEIEARTQERKAKLRKVKTEIYKRGVKL
jgi:uncharacterized protein